MTCANGRLIHDADSHLIPAFDETRLQKLSARPSEIVQRQLRVTPYPHEDSGWIAANSGPGVCLFSSACSRRTFRMSKAAATRSNALTRRLKAALRPR